MLPGKLSARLPDFHSIVPVFAVVSLVLYGWTFISIFWKLNSWRLNLTAWEILSVISYSMVKSFVETILIMAGILALSLFLPSTVSKRKFTVRASIAALFVLLSMMLQMKLQAKLHGAGILKEMVQSVSQWWTLAIVLTVILVAFLPMFRVVEKTVYEIADRAVVFLYIFLPVTMIGFVVLIIRFLFAA
jgi:hypothetical protein